MSIKFNEQKNWWEVSFSKRHPIKRQAVTLKRVGIKTKTEAVRVERELIVEVCKRIQEGVVPRWFDLVKSYIEHMRGGNLLQESTIYGKEKMLNHHTMEDWGNRPVDQIARNEISALVQRRLSDNAESHKKYLLKCIRGAFQYGVDQGMLKFNPTPLMKFKPSDKIKGVLTEEQILLLLRRAQEVNWHWYPHYAMAVYTGMRNGELYALTWEKVNLELRQIKVDCSWNSKNGFKETKSGNDRIVEIPRPLLPLLQELKLKSGGNPFVLPRLSKWDKGEQARELRFFLLSIGLPEIRFHDLRASYATWLLSKGVAPSKVMKMGGWADMDTMIIYLRKAGIDIKNSTSVLDEVQTHGVTSGSVVALEDFRGNR